MNYLRVPWVFILLSFHPSGDGTRIVPMVVWDHRNPLLKCKCNWLTIPKFDIYDKLSFICPSRAINVHLMEGYLTPKEEMNVNIFRRKVEKTTDFQNLTKSLMDGSFCDPAESLKLHSCLNGEDGKSFPVIFQPESKDEKINYNIGDMFVFFNNGDNGKSATLGSKEKKCSMVFIVNVTGTEQQQYDMSYGKCLNPQDTCDNANVSCRYQCLIDTDNAVTNPSLTCPTPNPTSVKTSRISETPKPSTKSSTDPNSKVIRCYNFYKQVVVCNNTDSRSSRIFKCNSTYYSNVTCKYFEDLKIYTCNLGINRIDLVCVEITDTKDPNTDAQSSNTSDRYYLPFLIAVIFASILGFLNLVNIFVVSRKICGMKPCIKKSLVSTTSDQNTEVFTKTSENKISHFNGETEQNNAYDGENNRVCTTSPGKDDEPNSDDKE